MERAYEYPLIHRGADAPSAPDPGARLCRDTRKRAWASAAVQGTAPHCEFWGDEFTIRALAGPLLVGFEVMPDVHAFHHEEGILGDVGGMVGDALQVPRDENEIDRLRNHGGIALHERNQLGVN